jgi:hypothetical protein
MRPRIEERPTKWVSQSNLLSKQADIEVSAVQGWGDQCLSVELWGLLE